VNCSPSRVVDISLPDRVTTSCRTGVGRSGSFRLLSDREQITFEGGHRNGSSHAAAGGLALLSVGAVAFHLRASDRAAKMAPAVIGIALGAAAAVLHTV
jgi:hypothetical protein